MHGDGGHFHWRLSETLYHSTANNKRILIRNKRGIFIKCGFERGILDRKLKRTVCIKQQRGKFRTGGKQLRPGVISTTNADKHSGNVC
jgi:hypothetical protein